VYKVTVTIIYFFAVTSRRNELLFEKCGVITRASDSNKIL